MKFEPPKFDKLCDMAAIAESYFALLKRGVHGTFHHISKQHLGKYCKEFQFRWNYRKVNDGKRAEAAIRGADGKRLTYKKAIC